MTTDRPLTCKFCGRELFKSTGARGYAGMFIMFRAADGHQESDPRMGDSSDGWCLNRAGAITYHHPDAPEWNGGVDHSDGRSLRALVDA